MPCGVANVAVQYWMSTVLLVGIVRGVVLVTGVKTCLVAGYPDGRYMTDSVQIENGLTSLREAHFQMERAFFALHSTTMVSDEAKSRARELLNEIGAMQDKLAWAMRYTGHEPDLKEK